MRLGKPYAVYGPGLCVLIPVLDSIRALDPKMESCIPVQQQVSFFLNF